MTEFVTQLLSNEDETVASGARLGALLSPGLTVFLEGQLGAGKTTLTRGILLALGHSGAVKSPTYTLVEPYDELTIPAYHFDLYRLGDPEELAYLGIRDYFHPDSLCIVEWPERGVGFLPEADIRLELQPQPLAAPAVSQKDTLQDGDASLIGRVLTITAITDKGKRVLSCW